MSITTNNTIRVYRDVLHTAISVLLLQRRQLPRDATVVHHRVGHSNVLNKDIEVNALKCAIIYFIRIWAA